MLPIPWRPVSTAVQTRRIRYFTANAVEDFASAYTTFRILRMHCLGIQTLMSISILLMISV